MNKNKENFIFKKDKFPLDYLPDMVLSILMQNEISDKADINYLKKSSLEFADDIINNFER